ncbi:hypothetical protein E3E23_08835 [Thermococcus sp. CX2]|uniref:hypothetical protein n=1 Tax=Thermococcus sp. CX2 TaxID=163006 RepID=UPI00143C5092|nr:hypothetical protein [Thermococcus sp. CX2]NJE85926.1 hypothetical protein [Thermococcus sp. CX2]
MVKALVIISSEDEKALVGFMWATNALKYKWVEDVEVILFGPIERKIAEGDGKFLQWIERLRELGKLPLSCRRIAEDGGFAVKLEKYTRVEYVGKIIADYLEKGYVPMTF